MENNRERIIKLYALIENIQQKYPETYLENVLYIDIQSQISSIQKQETTAMEIEASIQQQRLIDKEIEASIQKQRVLDKEIEAAIESQKANDDVFKSRDVLIEQARIMLLDDVDKAEVTKVLQKEIIAMEKLMVKQRRNNDVFELFNDAMSNIPKSVSTSVCSDKDEMESTISTLDEAVSCDRVSLPRKPKGHKKFMRMSDAISLVYQDLRKMDNISNLDIGLDDDLDIDIVCLYSLLLLIIEFHYWYSLVPEVSSETTPAKKKKAVLSEDIVQHFIFCVIRVLCNRKGFTLHDCRGKPMLYLQDKILGNFKGKTDLIVCHGGDIVLLIEMKVFFSLQNFSQFYVSSKAITCGKLGSWNSDILINRSAPNVYSMIFNGFTGFRARVVDSEKFQMDATPLRKIDCLKGLSGVLSYYLVVKSSVISSSESVASLFKEVSLTKEKQSIKSPCRSANHVFNFENDENEKDPAVTKTLKNSHEKPSVSSVSKNTRSKMIAKKKYSENADSCNTYSLTVGRLILQEFESCGDDPTALMFGSEFHPRYKKK